MKHKHAWLSKSILYVLLVFSMSALLNSCDTADRKKTPPQKLAQKSVRIAVVTFCASEVIYFEDDKNKSSSVASAGVSVYLKKFINSAVKKGLKVSTPVIDSYPSESKLGSGLFKGDSYHSAHEKLGIIMVDDDNPVLPQALVNRLRADCFLWVASKFSLSGGGSKPAAKLKWEKSFACEIESDVKLFGKSGTQIWSSKFSTSYKVPFKGEYKVLSQKSSVGGKEAFKSIEYISTYAAEEMVNRLTVAVNSAGGF